MNKDLEPPSFVGIVLRSFPYGETDVILRILSPNGGKRSVLARGTRKEKSKFQMQFEVFDSGQFTTKVGRGSLESLVHFSPHRSLTGIRADLDLFVISSCIVEAYDNLTHEDGQDAVDLYESLGLSLRAVEEAADTKEALRALFISLATVLQLNGFFASDREPSLKNLLFLMNATEEFSEKELKSKASVIEILDRLRKGVLNS